MMLASITRPICASAQISRAPSCLSRCPEAILRYWCDISTRTSSRLPSRILLGRFRGTRTTAQAAPVLAGRLSDTTRFRRVAMALGGSASRRIHPCEGGVDLSADPLADSGTVND